MTPPTPPALRRPAWAGRNYTLLTAAAVVTGLGSSGALIAAAVLTVPDVRRLTRRVPEPSAGGGPAAANPPPPVVDGSPTPADS